MTLAAPLLLAPLLGVLLCPTGMVEPGRPGAQKPELPAPITALCALPSGDAAVSGSARGELQLWSVTEGIAATTIGRVPGAVVGIATLDAGRAVVLDDRGELFVAAMRNGGAVDRMASTGVAALALAKAPSGERVAVAGQDGHVRLFGVDGGAQGVIEAHDGPVAAVAFADDERLLTLGWDGRLRRFRLTGKRPKRDLDLRLVDREGAGLAATTDTALASSYDGSMHVLSPRGRSLRAKRLPARPHEEWVGRVLLGPGGRRGVGLGYAESALFVIDTAEASVVATIARPSPPCSAAFVRGGAALLVGGFDGRVDLVALPAAKGDAE